MIVPYFSVLSRNHSLRKCEFVRKFDEKEFFMILQTCDLNHISRSVKYQYRCYGEHEGITDAILRTGLCDPVYLYNTKNTFLILDGFKRIQALRKINRPVISVPALVLTAKDLNYETHKGLILKQNVPFPLPFSERVSAYLLLKKNYPDIDSSFILRDLSLPDNRNYHNIYQAFSGLDHAWFSFFTDHDVPGRRIMHFIQAGDLNTMSDLLQFNMGINRLEQVVVMLAEISRRDHVTILEILNKILPETQDISARELFYRDIYRLRYPMISRYENKMNEALKSLNAPPSVISRCDVRGERPGIFISMTIQDEQDLEECRGWLKKSGNQIASLIKKRHER
jgi:hypothetical protein